MTAPLTMRLRRVLHALTHESAWRTARFVRTNRTVAGPAAAPVPAAAAAIVNPDLDLLPLDHHVVPPIIFQTWKSRSIIPANYRHWRDTFVALNPDRAVLLWDDADNRAFIAARFPWFLPVYDAYPGEIYRADAVRLFFLFQHGGLYADMDSECLRPIDATVAAGDVILCRMGGDPRFAHAIPNAIMASRPRQLFWLHAIALMTVRAAERAGAMPGPEEMTGPVLLKDAHDAFAALDEVGAWAASAPIMALLDAEQRASVRYGRVTLLPAEAWYPLDWTNLFHKQLCNQLRHQRQILDPGIARRLFPRSTLVTYWSHSW